MYRSSTSLSNACCVTISFHNATKLKDIRSALLDKLLDTFDKGKMNVNGYRFIVRHCCIKIASWGYRTINSNGSVVYECAIKYLSISMYIFSLLEKKEERWRKLVGERVSL